MQRIYEWESSVNGLRAASGRIGNKLGSARGSPQTTLGRFRQSIGKLVLGLFNAHGAKRPALLKSWLTMLGPFVPGCSMPTIGCSVVLQALE